MLFCNLSFSVDARRRQMNDDNDTPHSFNKLKSPGQSIERISFVKSNEVWEELFLPSWAVSLLFLNLHQMKVFTYQTVAKAEVSLPVRIPGVAQHMGENQLFHLWLLCVWQWGEAPQAMSISEQLLFLRFSKRHIVIFVLSPFTPG